MQVIRVDNCCPYYGSEQGRHRGHGRLHLSNPEAVFIWIFMPLTHVGGQPSQSEPQADSEAWACIIYFASLIVAWYLRHRDRRQSSNKISRILSSELPSWCFGENCPAVELGWSEAS